MGIRLQQWNRRIFLWKFRDTTLRTNALKDNTINVLSMNGAGVAIGDHRKVGRAVGRFQSFYLPKITHVLVVTFVLVVLYIRCPSLAIINLYSILFFSAHAISMSLFLITSFLDPGYVSRGSVRSLLESMGGSSGGGGGTGSRVDSSCSSSEEDPLSDENSDNEPLLQLCYKDTPISFRRCNYCQLMQPLRAKHCEECERCIRKFDHHCPWLGNCVGEKNHKFFWCLLLSGLITTSWTLHITYQSFHSQNDVITFLQSNWLLIITFFIQLLFFCVCIVLFSAHTYLMVSNQTSWEFLARSRITYLRDLGDENPFDKGVLHNCYGFLCHWRAYNWECHFMNVTSREYPSPPNHTHDHRGGTVRYSKHPQNNTADVQGDPTAELVNTV